MEDLHDRVGGGKDVEAQIHEIVHLDIAEWTNGGKTLFHAAGEAGNLKAIQQLISQVTLTLTQMRSLVQKELYRPKIREN